MFLAGCDLGVGFRLYVRFFNVSLFLVFFCCCVGQILFGHIKFMSVTIFLMKNMLRHSREKNGSIDPGTGTLAPLLCIVDYILMTKKVQ